MTTFTKEYYFNHLHNLHSNITKDKIYIFEPHKPYFLQLHVMHCCLSRNGRFYSPRMLHEMMDFYIEYESEQMKNEYRKFIKESKYGRIAIRNKPLSIPRVQCAKSYGNNIKYASRRFLNDMGK